LESVAIIPNGVFYSYSGSMIPFHSKLNVPCSSLTKVHICGWIVNINQIENIYVRGYYTSTIQSFIPHVFKGFDLFLTKVGCILYAVVGCISSTFPVNNTGKFLPDRSTFGVDSLTLPKYWYWEYGLVGKAREGNTKIFDCCLKSPI
jgi:hypothetical protein